MLSTAVKIEFHKIYEINKIHFPPTAPHISFAGKIHTAPQQSGDDCLIEIHLSEYNNFSFADKGRMNIKMQVVYDAGQKRFAKISSKLQIGKLVFISGFLDLDGNESPFVEAKEIDILDEFMSNSTKSYNSQSPFSRTNKFKNNKNIGIKNEKTSDYNTINISTNKNNENNDIDDESDINIDTKDEVEDENDVIIDTKDEVEDENDVNIDTKDEVEVKINNITKKRGKRKLELVENIITDNDNKEDNETKEECNGELYNQEIPKKYNRRKTRSQKNKK